MIVTTSDPARPQHAVQMRWNLAPKFAANTFEFKPPRGQPADRHSQGRRHGRGARALTRDIPTHEEPP